MAKNNFWRRVDQRLKETKTTQKDLAEYLNIPHRTLENWIGRGIYPVTPDGYRIARFLGVSVEYLLSGKERKTESKIAAIRSMLKKADEKLKKL